MLQSTRRKLASRIYGSRAFAIGQLHQKATFSEDAKPVSKKQKYMWENYVSTGRGASALFTSIDTDRNGMLHPNQLKAFIYGLSLCKGKDGDPKDIFPYAWNRLEQRATMGQSYDIRSFKNWLISATKMSADQKNSRLLDYLKDTPKSEKYYPEMKVGDNFSWNKESMSQSLRRMQYAVRGEVVMKADQMAAQGREILYTNIGNPHQVGQNPITYYRQVLALCDLPAEVGVDHPQVNQLFPEDVVKRAKEYRKLIGSSGTGAYTHSQGILGFRKQVANFIQQRDGYRSYPGNIFLTNGASSGIGMVLQGLLASNRDAIMIPIPQYPIYSALISKLGGRQVGYDLDEELNWSVTRDELDAKFKEARLNGLNIKALAMINPGNPSGNVMTHCDIQVIAEFCSDNGIVLLADEVYQANVYAEGAEFVSAKKVALDCQLRNLQLISFHSTSKGLIGECGRRGGYMELHHIDPFVQSQLYKLASSELCSGVVGKIMNSLIVSPPLPEDDSYGRFEQENEGIYQGLKERSKKLVEGLNKIPGINCAVAEGAMYAFPSIEVPEKAFQKANELGTTTDNLYALSLLEETGICVVPASGFGQAKGRVGFRTTFLHPDTLDAIDLFAEHHEKFVKQYS